MSTAFIIRHLGSVSKVVTDDPDLHIVSLDIRSELDALIPRGLTEKLFYIPLFSSSPTIVPCYAIFEPLEYAPRQAQAIRRAIANTLEEIRPNKPGGYPTAHA